MGIISYSKAAVKRMLDPERVSQLDWLLAQADSWKHEDYNTEIPVRVDYIDKNMREDMLELLKLEFEKTYSDMENQYILLPVMNQIVSKKAQLFRGKGNRFFLRTRASGEELKPEDPRAVYFEKMLALAHARTTLRRGNEIMEGCNNAALKVWWDIDHVRTSVFPPNDTYIAVNPDRYWDPYSAYGVLFELPGVYILDTVRYEVWATRDKDIADDRDIEGKPIFYPTLHFVTNKKDEWPVNSDDVNPFKNPLTNQPIYPFTWLSNNLDEVYRKGGNNLVELNRTINLGMTYLNHCMSWAMLGIPTFERQAGSKSKLPATRVMSPKHAMEIPPDIKFSFTRDDFNSDPFVNVFEMFIQYNAMMNHLSPKSLSVREGLPQSGIALKIEFSNLVHYHQEMIEIIKPQVIDFLTKMIIVSNLYGPTVKGEKIPNINLKELVPDWDPGQIDTGPTDYVQLADRMERECAVGVSSYDDWAMIAHTVDKTTAKNMIDENIKRNAEIKSLLRPDLEEEPLPTLDEVETEEETIEKPETETEGKSTDGAGDVESEKIVANVYQIVKAIEVGAATAVDLRQLLFPNEDRATAEAVVRSNVPFNLEMARIQGEMQAAEQKAIQEGKPTPEPKDMPPGFKKEEPEEPEETEE